MKADTVYMYSVYHELFLIYTVHWTLYNHECITLKMYIAQYTLYIEQLYTLHTAHYTLHCTLHWTVHLTEHCSQTETLSLQLSPLWQLKKHSFSTVTVTERLSQQCDRVSVTVIEELSQQCHRVTVTVPAVKLSYKNSLSYVSVSMGHSECNTVI